MPRDPERLEVLLAEVLAALDSGGDAAVAAFLAAHPEERAALERGLARARQMGLSGGPPAAPDFPERLGEFRLLRRLGSGGMGVVYEAEQESLGRRVALKVVRPELLYFDGARERFRREIEAIARVSHPAIVPVLASGEQDGVPWYAMELLHGRSLHEITLALRSRDPADLRGADLRALLAADAGTGTDPFDGPWWQVAARIALAAALGMRHVHLRGIVHRDIKPSNVMLTNDGRTVLLDFGVARLGGKAEFTRTGGTPGSPAFMSPEQLRGDAVDERTDVYSLAATLWQLLTLEQPFGNGELQRGPGADAPSPSARNKEIPRELDLVVRTAMDADRERRYPDMQAFADDLLAVLQRRPIRARRLSPGLRLWRWGQRHRVAATFLACGILAAAALPLVFAWRERAVNRELAAAVRTADESLATTLDAIYSLLVRVGEDRLRYVPAAGRLAVESLGEACGMYRTLVPRHPDHVRLRVDAGKAMTRYADVLTRAGRATEAAAVLREAIDWLGGESIAVHDSWRNTRSYAWINLGSTLQTLGDRAAAERSYDAAARDLEALAARPEFAVHSGRAALQLLACRAELRVAAGDREGAEPLFRSAVELAREQQRLHPDDPLRQQALALRLDALATLLVQMQRGDEALPLLDEALAVARGMPADAAVWPTPALVVADVLETLGTLHVQRRDLRAAAALKECLALREAAAQAHPADVEIRSDVAAALHNLANMNFHQEQYDLAVERLDRAIGLQRSVLAELPEHAQGRTYLQNHLTLRGRCLSRLGRAADLAANAASIEEIAVDARTLRIAASQWLMVVRALDAASTPPDDAAALRLRACDRAIAALLAAERAGWGRGNRLAEALYDPLRRLPEFQALEQRVVARQSTEVSPPSTSNASREMPR